MVEGRVGCVIVVGAGTGTGAEVARLFAEEGHPVVVSRRSAEPLSALVSSLQAAGARALAVVADASDEQQVVALFDRAEAAFGGIDAVVFNAAGFGMGSVLETSVADFEGLWRATALGGFIVGREAARRMLPRGRGTLLFSGATASVKASARFSAFASGKHGLRAVAQSLAKELGPQGVHVAHAIIDGMIDVPRLHEQMPELARSKGEAGLLDPRAIAQAFLSLHRQPRNAWTFELDLRPFCEAW